MNVFVAHQRLAKMAVEGALAQAKANNRNAGIMLDGALGLEDDLVARLIGECFNPNRIAYPAKQEMWQDGLAQEQEILDQIFGTISDMFEDKGRVPTRAQQANPTFYTPQLVRESTNCPGGIEGDVLGLLDVGLMHHNNSETRLAVATYIEALKAASQPLPRAPCTPPLAHNPIENNALAGMTFRRRG